MRNNVSFNILASYAYLNNDKVFCDWCFGLHKDGIANVMIDSGAFTLHNAKQKRDWLTVDNYCRFLEKYGNNCEKYVMLDVVGNDIQSKKNYELMVSRGFEPMFVLTMFDKDWQYLNETLNTNQNICVAGGVTTKGDWMTKRFQDVSVHTDKRAKVHGLGYVTFPKMFQVPLVSVDSSSWKQAALCYGTLNYFTPQGVKGMPYKDILKKARIEALNAISDVELKILGTDIDPEMVKLAKENIESLGFESDITVYHKDFRDIIFQFICSLI